MNKQYVEQREGVYWVAETRVSLDSIVYAFLDGQTAEGIAQSFPVLTLEQVYGAITFYLANRPAIDAYLRCKEAAFKAIEAILVDRPMAGARINLKLPKYPDILSHNEDNFPAPEVGFERERCPRCGSRRTSFAGSTPMTFGGDGRVRNECRDCRHIPTGQIR